ncbi:hypothetical protein BD413DRAFT_34727 [Trametes elegans]|nr:hypothetical protein BD413DRAFT_34727 [Trametes elegans]
MGSGQMRCADANTTQPPITKWPSLRPRGRRSCVAAVESIEASSEFCWIPTLIRQCYCSPPPSPTRDLNRLISGELCRALWLEASGRHGVVVVHICWEGQEGEGWSPVAREDVVRKKIDWHPPCTYPMSESAKERGMVPVRYETKLSWPKMSPQGREAARAMPLDPRPPSSPRAPDAFPPFRPPSRRARRCLARHRPEHPGRC